MSSAPAPACFSWLDAATGLAVAGIAALALWTALAGPIGPIPMHYDFHGRVDRFGGRAELAGLLAVLAVITALVAGGMGLAAARADDPARRRGLRTGQGVALLGLVGVTALVAALALRFGGGDLPDHQGWLMGGLGLLFAVIGAALGRVGPNPVVGVRTPWSYKSRLAWDRSNRLAGRLMFGLGLIALVLAPIAPQPLGMTALIAAVLIAAAASVYESWRVWRTDPERQPF